MAALGTIFSVLGTVVSAAGQMAAANQEKAAAEWQAKEYERQARAERAAGQREAEQQERKKDLALSRLQTVAAASGFSATDPTALNIGGEIERYGTMQQQMSQYGGADRAAGLESQATATRLSAKARATGARYSAFGTILGGIGGLAKYQGGGSSSSGGGGYVPFYG